VSIIVGYWIERYTWIAGAASDSPMSDVLAVRDSRSVVIFGTGFFLVRGAMRKYGLIKIAD
jgi:hypothetical protein